MQCTPVLLCSVTTFVLLQSYHFFYLFRYYLLFICLCSHKIINSNIGNYKTNITYIHIMNVEKMKIGKCNFSSSVLTCNQRGYSHNLRPGWGKKKILVCKTWGGRSHYVALKGSYQALQHKGLMERYFKEIHSSFEYIFCIYI